MAGKAVARKRGRPKNQHSQKLSAMAAKLPNIPQHQHLFVMLILEGKDKVAAYKEAYNPPNSTDRSISINAYRALNNAKIQQHLHFARLAGLEKGQKTFEQHVDRLNHLSHSAQEAGQYGPAVAAEKALGNALGYQEHTVRVESDHGAAQALKILHDMGVDVSQVIESSEEYGLMIDHEELENG